MALVINKKNLINLNNFFEKKKKNNDYEIETRFTSKKINQKTFELLFNKLTFNEENGGLNFKNYKFEYQLDIILNNLDNNKSSERIRIIGEDVKKYWLFEDINKVSYDYIIKKKIENIDIPEYNIRFSLSEEKKNDDNKKVFNKDIKKYFRLKNRYSINTNDNLFKIDITSIKSGYGINLKDVDIFNSNNEYELELEYIGGIDLNINDMSNKLIENTWLILSIIQNNINILNDNDINEILDGYKKIVTSKDYKNNNKIPFIAASPVTLHRINMIQSNENQNILNKYAVTLKADGERNFLYVHKSNNYKLNGKLYLINNNFDIIELGLKNEKMVNSLIEGEYIKELKLFLAYDILFYEGVDVRLNQLNVNVFKKGVKNSRMEYLNNFINNLNKNKTFNDNYNESNIINVEIKNYFYSKSPDGKDIFKLFDILWTNRKNNKFNVDGVIFTPILENYPLKGGSWSPLFKWKPPELNTIDFLVKFKKDNNNNDIILPYYIRDKNNKIIKIKQYKVIELYVGKESETINKKTMQKYIECTPFNPYNVNEENIHKYNVVNLFLEDGEKIYTHDPITNNQDEIIDDIIVEFSYDENKEDYYKWKPIRVRNDKTRKYKNNRDNCGNYEKIAYDIYKTIIYPITFNNLSTGEISKIDDKLIEVNNDKNNEDRYFIDKKNVKIQRLSYQNFHNLCIKDKLLSIVAPYKLLNSKEIVGKILDLGVGKGYEINRWKKYKFAEAVGIDRDHEAIEIAKDNFKTVPRPKPKTFFIRGDTSKLIFPNQECAFSDANKIRLKQYIPIKNYFDVVSIQFAIHYFFKDEISLRTILQNINDNLKINGYLIGTCFSGERIYEVLKNKKEIKGENSEGDLIWSIKKNYNNFKFEKNKPILGKSIDVFIKSIGINHQEYLVNFEYFDKMLIEYGFEKVLVSSFEDEYYQFKSNNDECIKNINMSDAEKEFSFYNNMFIYKKVSNTSINLFNKLVKLISKEETIKYKNKLKKNNNTEKNENVENVEYVSDDTENLIENAETKKNNDNDNEINSELEYQIESNVN